MQGYIINMNRAREEDIVVTILTQKSLDTLYRFYGARHGTINLGFKIDFEINTSLKSNIAQLRDVIHIGFPWITDRDRLYHWQQFTSLFYRHLKDSEETGGFYFDLLDYAASRWHLQNPKRVAIESYIKILEYEGRLHKEMRCFFCEKPIKGDVSLIRSYFPSHPQCSHAASVNQDALTELFENQSSFFLDDREVERLWFVMAEGL
jgi:hypothetical protein